MYFLFVLLMQGSPEKQILVHFKHTVEILANDDMMGRSSLRPEIWKAANYIHQQFKEIGLMPLANGSYFQKFTRPEGQKIANVIGYHPAKEPSNNSIIFSAHYDGLGIGTADASGDSIYNGAVDNAVGVAALIEIARLYHQKKTDCNIVFLATAAEEGGSYGAENYLKNPLFPLNDIHFVLNIDGFNIHGQVENIFIMPQEGVSFIDQIRKIAWDNFSLKDGSPSWVNNMNTSFDSTIFLKNKIPAVTIWSGDKMKGMSVDESRKYQFQINGRRHHKPSDEITELWNYNGVMDHIKLYMSIADFYMSSSIKEIVTKPDLFNK